MKKGEKQFYTVESPTYFRIHQLQEINLERNTLKVIHLMISLAIKATVPIMLKQVEKET